MKEKFSFEAGSGALQASLIREVQMPRSDFTHGLETYTLGHLESFTLLVTPRAEGAPTYNVLVTFGCHVFTRKRLGDDAPESLYEENGEQRSFCADRHRYSTNLPSIVHAAANGRAYFSQKQNLLLVDRIDGISEPYAVFFNMEKGKAKGIDATMFVVSAYPKERLPDELATITFPTLVGKVSRGEPVRRPKERRRIKK